MLLQAAGWCSFKPSAGSRSSQPSPLPGALPVLIHAGEKVCGVEEQVSGLLVPGRAFSSTSVLVLQGKELSLAPPLSGELTFPSLA